MSVLRKVDPSDPVYFEAQQLYRDRWMNPGKRFPSIRAIYLVGFEGEQAQDHLNKYSQYRSSLRVNFPNIRPIEETLFHGTHRACFTGDDNSPLVTPCAMPECAVCHILRCDFTSEHAKKNGYWGRGIYTTTAANKADYFSTNSVSQFKVVLLNKVLVGKPILMTEMAPNWTKPPGGYDSVKAITQDMGGVVKYSERVVYRDDALLPWVMIVYGP